MTYSTAIKILTIFILLMLIAAASPFFYYKFYPFRPVEDLKTPFPVNKPIVKAGEEISWTTSFCKTDDTAAKTTIILATQLKQIEIVKDKEFRADKGCYEVTRSALIPLDTPAGEATIEFFSDYKYPFGRIVPVRGRTVAFIIESVNKTAPINPAIQARDTNPPAITAPQNVAPVILVPANPPVAQTPNNPTVNANISTQITTPNICVPIINLCL